jgi:hypothetical protein
VVRAHLAAAQLADAVIEVRPLAQSRRQSGGSMKRDFALDRRVELRVFTADGVEASAAAEAHALQEEAHPAPRTGAKPQRLRGAAGPRPRPVKPTASRTAALTGTQTAKRRAPRP